jgi:hypothetical protein
MLSSANYSEQKRQRMCEDYDEFNVDKVFTLDCGSKKIYIGLKEFADEHGSGVFMMFSKDDAKRFGIIEGAEIWETVVFHFINSINIPKQYMHDLVCVKDFGGVESYLVKISFLFTKNGQ